VKLLILTQYYPPETGAPQNRLSDLAQRVSAAGHEVTVLTAMPNYPRMEIFEAYRGKSFVKEVLQGVRVFRTSIYVSKKKSIVARLRNYFSFVWSSAMACGKLAPQYDFLMCESPPLFLGYSAIYLSRRKKAKLIFNVSDLWPESAEKLGVVTNSLLLKLAYNLEAKCYQRAALVSGQTQGICKDIQHRFPHVKTYWLPNGADLNFYNPETIDAGNWRTANGFAADDFILLYAGIIGIAQGLDIIPKAAEFFRDQKNIQFVMIGAGPETNSIQEMIQSKGLRNVTLLPAVLKSEMPAILKNVNAALIPLRKLELFKGAIPSKIFEALAMELPVLLGVDGESRDLFIEQGKCGLYFEPENATALTTAIRELVANRQNALEMGRNGRKFVLTHFNRATIANNFAEQLATLATFKK
jgi:glycosyltransferase involved in cell wall biosynthesis